MIATPWRAFSKDPQQPIGLPRLTQEATRMKRDDAEPIPPRTSLPASWEWGPQEEEEGEVKGGRGRGEPGRPGGVKLGGGGGRERRGGRGGRRRTTGSKLPPGSPSSPASPGILWSLPIVGRYYEFALSEMDRYTPASDFVGRYGR